MQRLVMRNSEVLIPAFSALTLERVDVNRVLAKDESS
jgi:hypothetical protein